MEITISGKDQQLLKKVEAFAKKLGLRIQKFQKEDKKTENNSSKLYQLMQSMAESGGLSSIEDPLAWQSEVREETENFMDVSKTALIDSNIIIYSAIPSQNKLRLELKDKKITASIISKIEVLGYHKLVGKEMKYFESFFKLCSLLPIHSTYIEQAIKLRQERKMSVGDALIASTAIIEGIPLITANAKDFQHLSSLEVINPIN